MARNKEKAYAHHKSYIERNPERAKAYAFKARLKRRGCTLDQYNTFLIEQNYSCSICKGDKGYSKDWAIDHNHQTGKVRSLLCSACNLAIGHAREDTNILQQMIEYLKKHNE